MRAGRHEYATHGGIHFIDPGGLAIDQRVPTREIGVGENHHARARQVGANLRPAAGVLH
jgi:hypothetical protein